MPISLANVHMNFNNIFLNGYEQNQTAFKISADPLWLAEFVKVPQEKVYFADLGTGCGIIACALALNYLQYRGIGVELDMESAKMAGNNVQSLGLSERLSIEQGDLGSRQTLEVLGRGKYDLVVANPPFYQIDKARLPQHKQRQMAMIGNENTLDIFFSCAFFLLKDKGYFNCILVPNLLPKALNSLQIHGFGLRRMQCIYTKKGHAAKRIMLEARKNVADDVKIEPPLLVY